MCDSEMKWTDRHKEQNEQKKYQRGKKKSLKKKRERKKKAASWVVVHAFNPSTREADAGGSL